MTNYTYKLIATLLLVFTTSTLTIAESLSEPSYNYEYIGNSSGINLFGSIEDNTHLGNNDEPSVSYSSNSGCTDVTACNYASAATIDDGSCTYADAGFDCAGNIQALEIGALMYGGIVFYIDETGEHGLVAALEDITEDMVQPWLGAQGFEWGCNETEVSGADGLDIGAGYQNTIEIVAQNCQSYNDDVTAAQATLNYGYTDWYLPSKEELQLMSSTIGNEGLEDNKGGFSTETEDYPYSYYWSSSEVNQTSAWTVDFTYGATAPNSKGNSFRVRAVRAFGINELGGCLDSTACNYEAEAAFAAGACESVSCLDDCGVPNGDNSSCSDDCGVVNGNNSTCLDCAGVPNGTSQDLGCGCGNLAVQSGYDCEGNYHEIGDLVEGGIVFYIDETGGYGLVAALEDITEGSNQSWYGTEEGFEWGCYDMYLNGADELTIGTGYQNTIYIDAQNCQTEGGGITAAKATLNSTEGGYEDWFLPSFNELKEMYNTIGEGGTQGNIGGFVTGMVPRYWSSSGSLDYLADYVNFQTGTENFSDRRNSFRVRAIRSFVIELGGCLDSTACNYVSAADFDDQSCDYQSCLDECGVPNGDNSSCLDECGVINGDNSSCSDDCGVPNGDNSSCLDDCGVLNGDNSCVDECGVPNGSGSYNYYIDNDSDGLGEGDLIITCTDLNQQYCGNLSVSDGNYANDAVWYIKNSNNITVAAGGAPYDSEVCLNYGTYNLYIYDFYGFTLSYNGFSSTVTSYSETSGFSDVVPFSITSENQEMPLYVTNGDDLCLNDPENDIDGDGVCSIDEVLGCEDTDACNYNSAATETDGTCEYTSCLDDCGVPNGDNSCLDDCGVLNGDNSCLDDCGVLNGDNSSCSDDCGVPNGDNSSCLDDCGVLNGDNSCLDECGVPNGLGSYSYYIDNDSDGLGEGDLIITCTDLNQQYCGSLSVSSGTSPLEISWNIQNSSGIIVSGEANYSSEVCLNIGDYTLNMYESMGESWEGASLSFNGLSFTHSGGSSSTASLSITSGNQEIPLYVTNGDDVCLDDPENDVDGDGICSKDEIAGCLDQSAFNYNPLTTDIDGSCYSVVEGCNDSTAFNYNDLNGNNFPDFLTGELGVDINTDNGSCYPITYGCMNPLAFNYNDTNQNGFSSPLTGILGIDINTDDGSCSSAGNYQYSMSFTAILENLDGSYSIDPNDQISVFNEDGLCVGAAQPDLYLEPFHANAVFLMVYSNKLSQSYSVQVYFAATGTTETYMGLDFSSNASIGTVENPYILQQYTSDLVEGCIDATAFNYNSEANVDNGTCIAVVYGCTNNESLNFAPLSNTDDGSCVEKIEGCIDFNYVNFNPYANVQDNSCTTTWQQAYIEYNNIIDSLISNQNIGYSQVDLDLSYAEGYADALAIQDSCVIQEVDIPLNLPAGWSMFGYTCIESVDAMQGFTSISEAIALVKDDMGSAYIPEWGFNGIGNLNFGNGYQIKMIESVTNFQFCPTLIAP